MDEPYVVHSDTRSLERVVVSGGSYYALGDNRLVSSDSRDWGLVSDEHIIWAGVAQLLAFGQD